MMRYQVSYVVIGGKHPGAIVNELKRPQVGDRIEIGSNTFEVVEVTEVIPPRGDFAFLHATVKPTTAVPNAESDTGT